MTYSIRTYRPRPSMWQDRVTVEAAKYEEAVTMVRTSYQQTKRTTELYDGEHGTYCWFSISGLTGQEQDRNCNFGKQQ